MHHKTQCPYFYVCICLLSIQTFLCRSVILNFNLFNRFECHQYLFTEAIKNSFFGAFILSALPTLILLTIFASGYYD